MRALLLLLCATALHAEIIPPIRLATWRDSVGVLGGIPNRTTVYTNVPLGVTDSQLETIINACPSNQVIQLAAGTYNFADQIRLFSKSYVTLRGAGMGQTILRGTNGTATLAWGDFPWIDEWSAAAVRLTNDLAKSAISMTLSNVAAIDVLEPILIEEDNDGTNTFGFGSGGSNSAGRLRDGNRVKAQIVWVTNKTGNTISFSPPLNFAFTTAWNAQVLPWADLIGPKLVGIEDMTITKPNGYAAWMLGAYQCWFKGVEITDWSEWGLEIQYCANVEVRQCYFHDPTDFDVNHGYSTQFDTANNCLVEDNIYYKYQDGIIFQGSCSANAVAYNLLYRSYGEYNGISIMLASLFGNHTPYPTMTLFEGNYANQIHNDYYYGPSATTTVLRNYLSGGDPDVTQNRIVINFDSHQWSNNVIGNILGSPGTNTPLFSAWKNAWITNVNTTNVVWERGRTNWNDFAYSRARLFRLGYPFIGNNSTAAGQGNPPATNELTKHDKVVIDSTIVHGNYEYGTGVVWDGGIADQEITNSYLYTSKPSYFGFLSWPPYGNDSACAGQPTHHGITNIPAGYRFIFGTNPPPGLAGNHYRNRGKSRAGGFSPVF